MKILFIAGGDSAHSHRWIGWFVRKRVGEVGWISTRTCDEIKDANDYKILPSKKYLSNKILNLVLIWFSTILEFIKWKPEIIHIHYMGMNGALGLLLPSKYKIFTAWGDDILFPKFPRLLKLMIKRADLFTVDAIHMKSRLIELGAEKEKIHIVNFGIETNFFLKKGISLFYRKKLFKNLAIENPLFISLRNHDPVYDIPTLIKAVPLVVDAIPNAKFAIGGSGPLTESYKEIVHNLDVREAVSFFGRYSHEDLPHLFGQTLAYISTSLSDAGIAASTAEAMSCQVAVVVSNTGENDLWIENTVNGFLFNAGDYKDLARILINIHRDSHLRKAVAIKGREVILERNDYDNEMEKMKNLYNSLI